MPLFGFFDNSSNFDISAPIQTDGEVLDHSTENNTSKNDSQKSWSVVDPLNCSNISSPQSISNNQSHSFASFSTNSHSNSITSTNNHELPQKKEDNTIESDNQSFTDVVNVSKNIGTPKMCPFLITYKVLGDKLLYSSKITKLACEKNTRTDPIWLRHVSGLTLRERD